MTSNGFEKFYGYRQNTTWIKIFLFAYVYVGIFAYAAIFLTKLSKPEMLNAVSQTLSGGGVTFEFAYVIITLLLIASFVVCGIFLPLIDMKGFYSTFVHLVTIVAYRPVLLLLCLIINGSVDRSLLITSIIMFVVSGAFATINFIYFAERRDLFEQSINELIMGEPKDELKH